jgi:PAS domain S-box-containing protein
MPRILRFVSAARDFFVPRIQSADDRGMPLQAIYDSAPFGIIVTDTQGRCLRANATYRRMTGFGDDELRGETLESLTHPDDRPRLAALLQELLSGREDMFTLVTRYRVRDGAQLWARISVSLHRDGNGAAFCLFARIENITERRQDKELLRPGAEPFHLLVESVTDYAIYMLDPTGRVASWNVGAERIKGYQAHEIIGQHFSRFYPREEVELGAPERELQAAIAHGRFENECWRLRKDGTRFWANAVITPMHDVAGTLRGFAKVTRDLTARRELEERLRDSEQTFRELVDILPIAVYACDAQGRIDIYNRRAVELWGRLPRQGTDPDLFCAAYRLYTPGGTQLSRADCPMGEVLRTGAAVTDREIVVERSDGSRRTVIVNSIPRSDRHGTLTGAINCLLDITDRKRAERTLQDYAGQLHVLSRRLVELHEDDRQALSRELHDRVGQNLTALNINLGIVLGQLPDAVRRLVAARLMDSQQLVMDTVDSITDVMADLRPPLLDDYGLIAALQSIAEQFSRRTGIETVVIGPDHIERLPHQVEISLCRIVQEALTNLAKHAQANHVEIELTLTETQITLAVADDGVGFVPGAQPEPSGRAGWGMLTMRERAVAMGGTLAIDSAPGRGTRVTVALKR